MTALVDPQVGVVLAAWVAVAGVVAGYLAVTTRGTGGRHVAVERVMSFPPRTLAEQARPVGCSLCRDGMVPSVTGQCVWCAPGGLR